MARTSAAIADRVRNPTTTAIVLSRLVYGAERLTSRYQGGFTPAGSSNSKTFVYLIVSRVCPRPGWTVSWAVKALVEATPISGPA